MLSFACWFGAFFIYIKTYHILVHVLVLKFFGECSCMFMTAVNHVFGGLSDRDQGMSIVFLCLGYDTFSCKFC